jgi:DNA polymerase (family 10)
MGYIYCMRHPRSKAESVLKTVSRSLAGFDYQPCGSFRRGLPTLHDLDIVVVADNIEDASADLRSRLPVSGNRILRGEVDGMSIDIYLCLPEETGAMTLFLTGSAEFNVRCRRAAKSRGMMLNQYGLHNIDGERSRFASEEQLLKAIGIDWTEPACR